MSNIEHSLAINFFGLALFAAIFPIFLAWCVNRFWHAGWGWWFYGMPFFLAAEAINFALGSLYARMRIVRAMFSILAATSLFSGPIEESMRYLGYRLVRRPAEIRWQEAIMFGLGHGAIETMAEKTLRFLGYGCLLVFVPPGNAKRLGLRDGTYGRVFAARAAVASLSVWDVRFVSLGIACDQIIHASLAVITVQSVLGRRASWLLAAMIVHSTFDFVIMVALPRFFTRPSAPIIAVACATLILGYIGIRLRPPRSVENA